MGTTPQRKSLTGTISAGLDMTDNPDDLCAVLKACWSDLCDLPPVEAAKSISSRVARLDRAARTAVLTAFLDDHKADSIFWPIFLEWWPQRQATIWTLLV